MKKCMTTLKLTALFFSIVISGILNAFSVYLPYWNLDKPSHTKSVSVIFQKGLFPIHWKQNPTFFNAVTVMMLVSSGVLICLFLMFLLSLMAILCHSARQVKIGFRLCAVITVLAGLFQLYSFIIMAIEFSLNKTPNWRIGGSKISKYSGFQGPEF
ncbi:DUF998 domain-containing protein [Caenorhabditis elegans]|uniref:DUF998 domain-containing protein n=1 Tax=Caenorhabditis elegans TaxID=6239 RepID=A0ACB1F304_CAEEL|eukprot:NP_001355421.1 Uncharacterized protein CELE_Y14H12A.5 [Caenorhabditis elegans]